MVILKKIGSQQDENGKLTPEALVASSPPVTGEVKTPGGNLTNSLEVLRPSATELPTLARGLVLQDRYEIEQILGMGGMSTVYRARDLRFTNVVRYCAVKEMIDSSSERGALKLANFEREASILATLSHPSIPKIYDFFAIEGRIYLVLEYIDGKDLESVMESKGDSLNEAQVRELGVQICDVLTYLHNQVPTPIVFRDMKPSNVMLSREGRVMLIDFGIAKLFQNEKKGTMIGTEGYSPPEQYRGVADPRGDIYALGATLHHLITNSDPRLETPFTFHDRRPTVLKPEVTKEIEAIIMKALEYDMNKRFNTPDEMRDALKRLERLSPGGAPSLSVPPPAPISTDPLPAAIIPKSSNPEPSGKSNSAPPAQSNLAPSGTSRLKRVNPTSALSPETAEASERKSNNWATQNTEAEEFKQAVNTPSRMAAGTTREAKLVWSFNCEDEVRSSPCVAKGMLYIGCYDHNLYCLNARTGQFRWKYPTNAGIPGTPCVWEDLVFIGSEDGSMYAIDAKTGKLNWSFKTNYPIRSSPRVHSNQVYFGSDDQHVYCLEANTGRVVWKYRAWSNVRSTPTIQRGTLFVGSSDNNLYAIDANNGNLRWKFATNGPIISSPAATDGLVIVGSQDSNLYAVDAETGYVAWKQRTGHFVTSSPAIQGNRVYVGGVDGFMYCFELSSGRPVWKVGAGNQVTSSPRVLADVVYFGSNEGVVWALSAMKGTVRWQFSTEGAIPSSPAIADGMVYIGSIDQKVYAFQI